VFARCQPGDGVCAIWIMRSNGTAKRAITPFKEGTREAVDFDIAVSPDGHRVAYTAFGQHGVAARIHIVDMTGANNHAVGPPALEAAQSDWSPNGARIVFTSNIVRLNDNLYTMAPDGSDLVQLTTARYPHGNYAAAFSPEGNQIAFFSDRHYPDLCCEDLFIMNADGSGQHLVPTGLTGGFEPAWGTSPVLPATTPSRITHPAAEPGSASMAREAPCRGLPEILARALC